MELSDTEDIPEVVQSTKTVRLGQTETFDGVTASNRSKSKKKRRNKRKRHIEAIPEQQIQEPDVEKISLSDKDPAPDTEPKETLLEQRDELGMPHTLAGIARTASKRTGLAVQVTGHKVARKDNPAAADFYRAMFNTGFRV